MEAGSASSIQTMAPAAARSARSNATNAKDRRETWLIREAGFPRPKRLADFDFTANPHRPGLIHTLAKGAWIRADQPQG
jgi:hypothetical protein